MAITKGSFKGQTYSDSGSNIQDLMVNMTGAKAMQSSVAKGHHHGMRGPGHDVDDPRRAWSVHIGNERLIAVPSGAELHSNAAATGRHQPEKELISGDKAPKTTGAGESVEFLNLYKPVPQGQSSPLVRRQQRRPGRFLGLRNK